MKGKVIRIGSIVLSVLLAAVFLMAGGTKLAGVEMHVQNFARWGYPDWFRVVTGLVELSGASLLLWGRTRFAGAVLLTCTMIGAVITHIRAAEAAALPVPGTLLVLAATVAWACRPGRTAVHA